ncbi:MAG: DUF3299 domain-containing protein [Arenicellales bacterium]|nr:DUF3299 domain-containing protein [Arenicellales bacterium]
MSVRVGLTLLMAVAGLLLPPFAISAQQMSWQDLGFTVQSSEDPFFGLGLEQKQSLETVLQVEKLRQQGSEIEIELSSRDAEARRLLHESGLNADQLIKQEQAFLAKLELQHSAVRKDLDGRDIRIPGYVLPLEFEGTKVIEFLLVPYAGACIHTPPPPPNQIIHVKVDQGFEANDMFTPVWVSGALRAELSMQQVGLSDGESEFGVGYTLDASSVEEYQ